MGRQRSIGTSTNTSYFDNSLDNSTRSINRNDSNSRSPLLRLLRAMTHLIWFSPFSRCMYRTARAPYRFGFLTLSFLLTSEGRARSGEEGRFRERALASRPGVLESRQGICLCVLSLASIDGFAVRSEVGNMMIRRRGPHHHGNWSTAFFLFIFGCFLATLPN